MSRRWHEDEEQRLSISCLEWVCIVARLLIRALAATCMASASYGFRVDLAPSLDHTRIYQRARALLFRISLPVFISAVAAAVIQG